MCKVLIIEDSPINMLLSAAVLARSGHETFKAANAVDGINVARDIQPDVILMDLGLPEMDGLAATRILKGDPVTKDIPIIVVTAYDTKDDRAKAFHDGCAGYVTKPIVPRKLIAKIEALAGTKLSDPGAQS
jgi:two-component system, cell cycle response regulator DivK